MSLKDDFLEALRSVKRDFLKDSDLPAQPVQPNIPAPAQGASASPVPEVPPPLQTDGFIPPPATSAPSFTDYSVSGRESGHSPTDGYIPPRNDVRPPRPSRPPDDFEPFSSAFTPGGSRSDFGSGFDAVPPEADPQPPYHQPGPNGGRSYVDGRSIIESLIPESAYDDNKTIISKGTVIRGALQTEDSVRLLGQILGDIDCKSNVLMAGKVRGNTSAANAFIVGAQVDGDVRCDDVVNIDNSAWILGNIKALQAEVEGKIKGNLDVRNSLSIGSNSSILGNISTDEIEIKRGAFINGQIMMYSPPRDMLDRFDQIKDN